MKGQTLIEVLLALSIAAVVITSVTILAISSLSNAQYIKNQDLATKYGQDGMETVLKIRNSSYTGFSTYNGLYCLGKGQTVLGSAKPSCTVANVDNFIRSVQIQQNGSCGANLAQVAIVVSWTDSKCQSGTYCHTSQISSCFSTVNPVTAP
ncbi:MAG TPA: hypothetical protein VE090_01935 [Methylomirabilota bacterium]|nr:hypothetical protein [Methylomirabilota bacterium]